MSWQDLRFHFAISFVALALLGAQALAAQVGVASDGRQVLVVWKVGPPTSGETPVADIPLNLERKAEAMGLRLEARAFTASEFAQEFPVAIAAHRAPDIVAVENAFSIAAPEGYKHGPGIASDPEVRKSLIQVNGSLKRSPDPGVDVSSSSPLQNTQRLPAGSRFGHLIAIRSLLPRLRFHPTFNKRPCRWPKPTSVRLREFNAYDDPARLRTEGVLWDSVDVRATKTCSAWGNDRLAFVSLVSNFEQDDPRRAAPSNIACGWSVDRPDTDPPGAAQAGRRLESSCRQFRSDAGQCFPAANSGNLRTPAESRKGGARFGAGPTAFSRRRPRSRTGCGAAHWLLHLAAEPLGSCCRASP